MNVLKFKSFDLYLDNMVNIKIIKFNCIQMHLSRLENRHKLNNLKENKN